MILVLTPLKLEFDVLHRTLGTHPAFKLALGGHGKVQFALSTLDWIQKVRPDLVICAGTAGALVPELKPLDVVAATQTLEHDFHLKFIKKPMPKFSGDKNALRVLKDFKASDFKLHFGAIASGDEDVMDAGRAREIQKRTRALAVAWEGAGGARACEYAKVPFLELRVISDTAQSDSIAEFKKNVEQGLLHISKILTTCWDAN